MPADPEWGFPNAAIPAGSPAYYVVRFAPAGQRDDLARLYAWRAELHQLIARAGDPGVARLKLDWWRAELERCAAGQARHPLARALTGVARTLPDLRLFLQMLEAAELEIRAVQPVTEQDLVRRLDLSGGAFAELILAVGSAGAGAGEALEAARRLGRYADGVRMLRDLHSSLRRHYCPLPQEALAAHRLRADRLAGDEPQERLARYARELTARLDPSGLHRSGRSRELLSVRRHAALARALHRKLERHGYPVMRRRVELSPIASLWTAWRLR